MPTPTRSRILKVTRSSRRRLGTPSALRLRGAASRIRFSNPPLNPRTHPGRGGVHEEADPEQVGLFLLGRVLKNPASCVLTSLRGSTYGTLSTLRLFARCGLAGRAF